MKHSVKTIRQALSNNRGFVYEETAPYSNPLSYVNKNVDLVEMLSSKRVGQSMKMLCPKLPGLPERANKDDYVTKGMSESERTEAARTLNRVTVAKSRRKKKLYNIFLDCLIVQLMGLHRQRHSLIAAYAK